jgi:hypothetical protein
MARNMRTGAGAFDERNHTSLRKPATVPVRLDDDRSAVISIEDEATEGRLRDADDAPVQHRRPARERGAISGRRHGDVEVRNDDIGGPETIQATHHVHRDALAFPLAHQARHEIRRRREAPVLLEEKHQNSRRAHRGTLVARSTESKRGR